ncbi:MAG: hypothetical protein EZS28_014015 [Streblomastix strix]|uniref:Uncharacterized protein n=1 Tax=Streblomastix strix TaxID=222440 RepID=A0A5J4W7M6_9EUKA|nr:MAG: hypothetical protein EZS28_014015 [Streblomastix strix]
MVTSIERNQFCMSISKKQIFDMKKELPEEDKLRLQSIDQALRNLSAPQQETKELDNINEHEVKSKGHYNKNKHRDVERESAKVEPEEGDTTEVGDFLPKYYPHAMGQLIIEPSDTILDQGIRIMKNKANWNSFVLTGCNADPADRDGVWKVGSTSSQFRIQKQQDQAYDYKAPIPDPPILHAIQYSIAYGMFEQRIWGTLTRYNDRWVIVRDNSEVQRCKSVLEPISSNIISVDNNLAFVSIVHQIKVGKSQLHYNNVVLPLPTAPTILWFLLITKIEFEVKGFVLHSSNMLQSSNQKQAYQIQQQINTSIQDIGQLQTDVQVINQELSRQTHFRGYFATNDEILALQSSAMGDNAYSAEDLLVWLYESNWIETNQIVPDQVTPACDTIPSNSIVNGSAGVSTEYSRGDYQHPLQESAVLPQQDTATDEEGVANIYA